MRGRKGLEGEGEGLLRSILLTVTFLLLPVNLMDNYSAPDLDDVKESVRQGVHKVAQKLGSLANDVFNRA